MISLASALVFAALAGVWDRQKSWLNAAIFTVLAAMAVLNLASSWPMLVEALGATAQAGEG